MRYRHEYKYQIDNRELAILNIKAAGVMVLDNHVNAMGEYTVRSLYFDDLYDSCVWDNLAGAEPRSKIRIRYYDDNTGYITLERKSKERNMTLKEACRITLEECELLIKGQIPELRRNDDPVKRSIISDIQRRGLLPKVIVTYQRVPYVYPAGNVRVTFDKNLSSSTEVNRFLLHDYITRPVYSLGQSIMEVKWDEVMPKHIKQTLHLENLCWTAFSKYYTCRVLHL